MKQYEVVLSQLAEIDINEIVSYYLQKNRDAAVELYKRIKNRILELRQFTKQRPHSTRT